MVQDRFGGVGGGWEGYGGDGSGTERWGQGQGICMHASVQSTEPAS